MRARRPEGSAHLHRGKWVARVTWTEEGRRRDWRKVADPNTKAEAKRLAAVRVAQLDGARGPAMDDRCLVCASGDALTIVDTHPLRFVCSTCLGSRFKQTLAAVFTELQAPGRGSERRAVRMEAARSKGTHTDVEWRELLSSHEGACANCGQRSEITKDHIVPVSRGGSDAIENLQPLCRSCNCSKGSLVHPSGTAEVVDG